MSRFVRPGNVVLPISNGDAITVRGRLNTGQTRELYGRMYRETAAGTRVIDPARVNLARLLSYLVDWTLTDDDGRPVPIRDRSDADRESILDALDPDDTAEIVAALDTHIAGVEAARAAEKKTKASGAPASSAISTLPAAADGGTSGSPSLIPMSTA